MTRCLSHSCCRTAPPRHYQRAHFNTNASPPPPPFFFFSSLSLQHRRFSHLGVQPRLFLLHALCNILLKARPLFHPLESKQPLTISLLQPPCSVHRRRKSRCLLLLGLHLHHPGAPLITMTFIHGLLLLFQLPFYFSCRGARLLVSPPSLKLLFVGSCASASPFSSSTPLPCGSSFPRLVGPKHCTGFPLTYLPAAEVHQQQRLADSVAGYVNALFRNPKFTFSAQEPMTSSRCNGILVCVLQHYSKRRLLLSCVASAGAPAAWRLTGAKS
jgi:hypothetical protein